eukprot:1160731-Pelagomonas_calceolata.AAC.8
MVGDPQQVARLLSAVLRSLGPGGGPIAHADAASRCAVHAYLCHEIPRWHIHALSLNQDARLLALQHARHKTFACDGARRLKKKGTSPSLQALIRCKAPLFLALMTHLGATLLLAIFHHDGFC